MTHADSVRNRLALTVSPMDLLFELKKHPDEILIIDVRNAPDNIKKEKIRGAVSIPQNRIQQSLNQIDRNRMIVLYCWETWCNLAAKAQLTLLEAGYNNVRELSGGIAAWKTLSLDTEALV